MEIPRIQVKDVREALRHGERVVFVDARSASAWLDATEQIPGSIRIPPDEADLRGGELPVGPLTVSYCT